MFIVKGGGAHHRSVMMSCVLQASERDAACDNQKWAELSDTCAGGAQTHLGDFLLGLWACRSGVQGMVALSPIHCCKVGSETCGRPCCRRTGRQEVDDRK